VATQQELKKKLSEEDARMIVIKNTLLKIAGGKSKLPKKALTDSVLSGQTALVLADGDPISPLKILAEFAREFNVPQMKVGIVEGSFQDKESLETLSKLPGKDGLQLQVLGAVAAPIYGMVGVLNANLLKLVSILDQKAKKGGDN
jgi:large subunit ribosomal protein L10